jgi:predicted ATPase
MTLLHAAWTHFHRREGRAVQEQGEAAKALCIEQGFPHLLGGATLCYGWALVEQGEIDAGIAQIQQGLATCRATGARLLMSFYPALLAEACGKAEQCEMGLSVVAEALVVIQQNGEHLYEAELYRLKGELILQQFGARSPRSQEDRQKAKGKGQKKPPVVSVQLSVPSPQHLAPSIQEAEACFHKAIEIACQQRAKSLELRAVTSLSRLWQRQGKQKEAHQMLLKIYNWFTEGFDTADLQEAKALLEKLS